MITFLGIDENLVWKSGISIPDASNHYSTVYNSNRIDLLRLLLVVLSQPLFYAPDEYLLVLNPFSTYFTNRRAKNCKNLFVSLVNTVLSYDCHGYVPILSLNYLGHPIPECDRFARRSRKHHNTFTPSASRPHRIQAAFN
jgi:hypothetical protein